MQIYVILERKHTG